MNLIESFKIKLDAADIWHKSISLKRNQFLKKGGTVDSKLYFIQEGSVRLFFEDDGEEQVIRLGYENNIIAALDSFISEKPSDIYMQAIKRSTVLVANRDDVMSFILSSKENMLDWIAILEQWNVHQIEREQDILKKSPKSRYERVLKRSPHLFQLIPAKHIASYLRMTPETLSRLKKS